MGYTNNVDEDESFEREFTAFATFDSSQMFTIAGRTW